MSPNFFLVAVFLLLGILNPAKGNLADLFIGFFIFGFCTHSVLNRYNNRLIVSLFLVFASWVIFDYIKGFAFIVIFASLAGIFLALFLEKLKYAQKLTIWILIGVFLIDASLISKELREFLRRDLPQYTYNNDPSVFLRTYQLMEHDIGYYESFKTAMLGRFDNQIFPQDIWGWRLPTLFLIWKLIPGKYGLSIYILFVTLASLILLTAFNIGKKYLGFPLGLLSSYLIFPYLHYGARDQMFLETEWWSVFLFIFGLYFLLENKNIWAMLFFTLTVLIRELYVLPLGLMMVYSLFRERKLLPIFVIPLFSFSILFIYHAYRVNYYIPSRETIIALRTVSDGLLFVQQTLSFASWEYLLFDVRPFSVLLLTATIGCLFLIKTKYKLDGKILLIAYLPFPIAFLRFGTLPYNDYWGILYVPLTIISAPMILGFIKRKNTNA